MEVFLDKRVRETCQTSGANSGRGATKKCEISRTLLSINLHFSVYCDGTFKSMTTEGLNRPDGSPCIFIFILCHKTLRAPSHYDPITNSKYELKYEQGLNSATFDDLWYNFLFLRWPLCWCTGLSNKVCPRLRDSVCWHSGEITQPRTSLIREPCMYESPCGHLLLLLSHAALLLTIFSGVVYRVPQKRLHSLSIFYKGC